ncbi:MAG: YlxR family protein [Syntrophomonadaceae bacterium]|nr:YlxR family protein [Syntrophomonadaceae bacterium]
MVRVKKIPQRKCVGCQEMRNKKDLIRVVRTPEGDIIVDPTGKKAGRGAYVCPSLDCLNQAIKGKRLEKALARPVGPEVLELLQEKVVT